MSSVIVGQRWWLHHDHQGVFIQIELTNDALLTVERNLPARREQKKLKSFEGALAYVEKLVADHQARGFRVTINAILSDEAERKQKLADRHQLEAERKARDAQRPAAAWRTGAAFGRDGFVAVNAGAVPADALAAILADGTRALQIIDDRDDEDDDETGDDCLTVLASMPRPSLTALVLDTHWQTPTRQTDERYGVRWGDLTPVFAALPSLTRAFVVGSFALQGGHATLEELQVVARGRSLSSAMSALREGAWPKLSFLGVCAGGEEGEDGSELATLLSSTALPGLRQLHVSGLSDPLAILRAAATRSGWTSIVIDGTFDDPDEDDLAVALRALAPRFAEVSVHLALGNALSDGAREELESMWHGLGDNVRDLFLPQAYRTYGE